MKWKWSSLTPGLMVAIIHRRRSVPRLVDQNKSLNLLRPLLTCEAVLSEAYFLLNGIPSARQSLLKLVVSEMVQVRFTFADEVEPIAKLLNRYANVPMSFADACLVRMGEQISGSTSSHSIATS